MDATFEVAGSPEDVNKKLRTPDAWLQLVPNATKGNLVPGNDDSSFTLITPYPIILHSIEPFTTIDAGYKYSVSLGSKETPEATFDVVWSFEGSSKSAGATTVRRLITNFQAHKKLCLPWTVVVKSKCAEENVNLQRLFRKY
jgi:hypothetical protein